MSFARKKELRAGISGEKAFLQAKGRLKQDCDVTNISLERQSMEEQVLISK
jgi:hypothetical protein